MTNVRVAALVGATATGKTKAALEVAAHIDAEIVSVDSMQIYRGMDIGTAKPTSAERARVRHHLIDTFEPDHDVTVSEFQALARAAVEEIAGRGKLPLLVGGSGLYFRAVVDHLNFPPRDPDRRRALDAEAEDLGAEALYARLKSLDPAAAERIQPTNIRRIVRALEVIEATGRLFSDNDGWERYESRYELAVAGLELPRDVLYERITDRVERMLEQGLIQEAQSLGSRGLSRTARQALGYRQILDAKEGKPLDELREAITRATKRFARRQESWFRADPRIRWFDASSDRLTEDLKEFFSRRSATSEVL